MLDCPVPPPLSFLAMAVPVLFALKDGSTKAVTVHNVIDDDGDLVVMDVEGLEWAVPINLLSVVIRVQSFNTLYRAFVEHRWSYFIRLKDNSVLISNPSNFITSRWLSINSENVLELRNIFSPITELTFTHLTELEYTFM